MSDPNLEPLPPECAALLDQLPRPEVAPGLKEHAWARIAASAAALPLSPPSGPATAGPAPAGQLAPHAALLGKWGAPLALAALVGGAGAGIAVDRLVMPPEPKVVVRTEVVQVPAPPVVVQVPPPAVPEAPHPPPKPLVKPPPLPEPVVAPPPELPSSEERQLIELARTALLKRSSGSALEAIARHRASFARGQLSEERDSLEVQALAQAGRAAEAREAAARFARTYPESVFGPAVEAAVRSSKP